MEFISDRVLIIYIQDICIKLHKHRSVFYLLMDRNIT